MARVSAPDNRVHAVRQARRQQLARFAQDRVGKSAGALAQALAIPAPTIDRVPSNRVYLILAGRQHRANLANRLECADEPSTAIRTRMARQPFQLSNMLRFGRGLEPLSHSGSRTTRFRITPETFASRNAAAGFMDTATR